MVELNLSCCPGVAVYQQNLLSLNKLYFVMWEDDGAKSIVYFCQGLGRYLWHNVLLAWQKILSVCLLNVIEFLWERFLLGNVKANI